jgi:hypothetical protein
VEEINNDFNTAYKETEDFYRASLLRNSSKPGYLEDAITSANQTFRSVLPLWHLINQHLPDLQAKTARYQAESLQGMNTSKLFLGSCNSSTFSDHSLESSIRKIASFASNVSHITMVEMVRLSEECERVSDDLNSMAVKIQEILSAHNNHSRYITDGVQLSKYTYPMRSN